MIAPQHHPYEDTSVRSNSSLHQSHLQARLPDTRRAEACWNLPSKHQINISSSVDAHQATGGRSSVDACDPTMPLLGNREVEESEIVEPLQQNCTPASNACASSSVGQCTDALFPSDFFPTGETMQVQPPQGMMIIPEERSYPVKGPAEAIGSLAGQSTLDACASCLSMSIAPGFDISAVQLADFPDSIRSQASTTGQSTLKTCRQRVLSGEAKGVPDAQIPESVRVLCEASSIASSAGRSTLDVSLHQSSSPGKTMQLPPSQRLVSIGGDMSNSSPTVSLSSMAGLSIVDTCATNISASVPPRRDLSAMQRPDFAPSLRAQASIAGQSPMEACVHAALSPTASAIITHAQALEPVDVLHGTNSAASASGRSSGDVEVFQSCHTGRARQLPPSQSLVLIPVEGLDSSPAGTVSSVAGQSSLDICTVDACVPVTPGHNLSSVCLPDSAHSLQDEATSIAGQSTLDVCIHSVQSVNTRGPANAQPLESCDGVQQTNPTAIAAHRSTLDRYVSQTSTAAEIRQLQPSQSLISIPCEQGDLFPRPRVTAGSIAGQSSLDICTADILVPVKSGIDLSAFQSPDSSQSLQNEASIAGGSTLAACISAAESMNPQGITGVQYMESFSSLRETGSAARAARRSTLDLCISLSGSAGEVEALQPSQSVVSIAEEGDNLATGLADVGSIVGHSPVDACAAGMYVPVTPSHDLSAVQPLKIALSFHDEASIAGRSTLEAYLNAPSSALESAQPLDSSNVLHEASLTATGPQRSILDDCKFDSSSPAVMGQLQPSQSLLSIPEEQGELFARPAVSVGSITRRSNMDACAGDISVSLTPGIDLSANQSLDSSHSLHNEASTAGRSTLEACIDAAESMNPQGITSPQSESFGVLRETESAASASDRSTFDLCTSKSSSAREAGHLQPSPSMVSIPEERGDLVTGLAMDVGSITGQSTLDACTTDMSVPVTRGHDISAVQSPGYALSMHAEASITRRSTMDSRIHAITSANPPDGANTELLESFRVFDEANSAPTAACRSMRNLCFSQACSTGDARQPDASQSMVSLREREGSSPLMAVSSIVGQSALEACSTNMSIPVRCGHHSSDRLPAGTANSLDARPTMNSVPTRDAYAAQMPNEHVSALVAGECHDTQNFNPFVSSCQNDTLSQTASQAFVRSLGSDTKASILEKEMLSIAASANTSDDTTASHLEVGLLYHSRNEHKLQPERQQSFAAPLIRSGPTAGEDHAPVSQPTHYTQVSAESREGGLKYLRLLPHG